MARTHMASDESLQQIFAAVSGTTMAAAGDGRTAVLATGNEDTIDRYYNALAQKVTTAREMNVLFVDWWTANWNPNTSTYNRMLERWFGSVLDDSRVHGVKFPLFSTSNTAIGELTDDSVGLSCTPSTAAESGKDDFAGLPQFWCVEVAAEKNEDGSHTIYACQYIDDDDFVRSTNHLVWVLQKNTYVRERNEGGYRILRMRCHPSGGYEQWPQGTDRTGKTYPYIANPKYFAGMQDDGKIGGHTGLAPVNYKSHTQLVQLWRARGSQYAGASGNLLKWQERMIQLKYARKGNSGTIEGCTSYNYQYTAAIDAEGVNYFPVTTEQAANLLIDSYVAIGTHTKSTTDRNDATLHDIQTEARITRIEDINVDGTGYKAVYVDTGDTWNVVKGQTMLSTMPYGSGYNDSVRGNDGSRTNYTNGKEPGLIQKTEFQNGAYLIVADELWQWGKDDDGNYTFDIYTCHDQTKVGLELKQAWQQVRFASFEEEKRAKAARAQGSKHRTPALDMMGFAVRRTYTIVRKGVFRRIRRQLIRAGRNLAMLGYVPHWRASKLTAYNGWFTNSDSANLEEKYQVETIMKAARWSVARWSMIQNNRRKAA